MVEYEDRFSDEEMTELIDGASLFLVSLRIPEGKKDKVTRLWYKSMHLFTAKVMDEFDFERCPDDLERCSDGACMPIGGC